MASAAELKGQAAQLAPRPPKNYTQEVSPPQGYGPDPHHQAMSDVGKLFPRYKPYLANVVVQPLQKQADERQVEFYPPWAKDNPNPGKATIQPFREELTSGQGLTDTIAGELLHYIGGIDERTKKPVDPDYYRLKQAVIAARTPKQQATDRSTYETEKKLYPETGSFEDWLTDSRIDQYIMGYIAPDKADEWRKNGWYKAPQMAKAVEDVRQFLSSENKSSTAAAAQPAPAPLGEAEIASRIKEANEKAPALKKQIDQATRAMRPLQMIASQFQPEMDDDGNWHQATDPKQLGWIARYRRQLGKVNTLINQHNALVARAQAAYRQYETLQPTSPPAPMLPQGSASAAPAPSVVERMRQSIANSAIGSSLEQATPGLAKLLHLEPDLVMGSPEARQRAESMPQLPDWANRPTVSTQRTALPNFAYRPGTVDAYLQEYLESAVHGQAGVDELHRRQQEGLAQEQAQKAQLEKEHPVQAGAEEGVGEFLGRMTTPANFMTLALAPALKPLMAMFAAQAATGTYDSAEAAYQAYRRGDNREAAKYATEAGLTAVVAGLAGREALRGEFPYDTARPSVTEPSAVMPEEPPMLGAAPTEQLGLPGGETRALPAPTETAAAEAAPIEPTAPSENTFTGEALAPTEPGTEVAAASEPTAAPMTAPSPILPTPAPSQQEQPKEAEAPSPQVERRIDALQRKRIDEMSPDEMRQLLLASHVVDLPNQRAFDEAQRAQPAAAVAMSDADGLKAFNDQFGYEAGNTLLRAKADALREAGLEAYHDSGDEFRYRGESPEGLTEKLEKAREILRNKQFDVTMDDGRQFTLQGVDFSYGTGTDISEAERGLHANKQEREQAGERRRGELAGITRTERPSGQAAAAATSATAQALAPAAPRTYEAVQRDIDAMESALEHQGHDISKFYFPEHADVLKDAPGWKPLPEDMVKLYAERDAIGSGQLQQSINEISKAIRKTGIKNDAEMRRILNYYGLDPTRTDAAKQYFASQYTMETVNRDPQRQAAEIYSGLAADRGIPMDDYDDLWRDRKTTKDAFNVAKAINNYFYRNEPEVTVEPAQLSLFDLALDKAMQTPPRPMPPATRQRRNVVLREALPGVQEHYAARYQNYAKTLQAQKDLEAADQQRGNTLARFDFTDAPSVSALGKLRQELAGVTERRNALLAQLRQLEQERHALTSNDPNLGEVRLDEQGRPRLYLNRPAMQIIQKVIGVQDGLLKGSHWTVPEVRWMRNRLAKAHPADMNEEKIWQPVMRLLDTAMSYAGSGDVTVTGKMQQGTQSAVDTLNHEELHRQQLILANNGAMETHVSPEAFVRLFSTLPGKAFSFLLENGYDPDPEKSGPQLYVIETAANIMGRRYREMGLTADEAARWLNGYFVEVAQQHGPQAIIELKHMRGVARNIQNEWGKYYGQQPAATGGRATAERADDREALPRVAARGSAEAQGAAGGNAAGERERGVEASPQRADLEGQGRMIDVVHYSDNPDIEELDPAHYGQNALHEVTGQRVNRPDEARKNAFPKYWKPETYTGDDSDPVFREKATERFAKRQHTYKGQIPASQVYDMTTDPRGLRAQSRQELIDAKKATLGVTVIPSEAEIDAYTIDKLKGLGYTARRDVNGMIASWAKVPVKKINPYPVDDIQKFTHPPKEQVVSHELSFGEGSPYGKEFPSLYDLPYEQGHAITQQVMRKVVDIAAKEGGIEVVHDSYGPGGYLDYPVQPSGQTVVTGSPKAVQRFMDLVGYLAQQTEVIGSSPNMGGPDHAIQIVDTEGDKLSDPKLVTGFWNDLRAAIPELQGFQPVVVDGKPGIRILSFGNHMEDILDKAHAAISDIAKKYDIIAEHKDFLMEVQRAGNNWTEDPTGGQYLSRLRETGRPGLQGRLDDHARGIKRAIEDAFKQHAGTDAPATGPAEQVTPSSPVETTPGERPNPPPETDHSRKPQRFSLESRKEIDRLKRELKPFDHNSNIGKKNSAALIAPNGKVVLGDYHAKLKGAVGYGQHKGFRWEKPFMEDGGVRVRAHAGETAVEFGKDAPETFERVRNVIDALPGDDFTVEFTRHDDNGVPRVLSFAIGDRDTVMADLDKWESRPMRPRPAYGTSAQFREQFEQRPRRFDLERASDESAQELENRWQDEELQRHGFNFDPSRVTTKPNAHDPEGAVDVYYEGVPMQEWVDDYDPADPESASKLFEEVARLRLIDILNRHADEGEEREPGRFDLSKAEQETRKQTGLATFGEAARPKSLQEFIADAKRRNPEGKPLIEGRDFHSFFDTDNYDLRHATGHNMLDPESVITGKELARGMTYDNSKRQYPDIETYVKAAGGMSAEELEKIAPRVLVDDEQERQPRTHDLESVKGALDEIESQKNNLTWKDIKRHLLPDEREGYEDDPELQRKITEAVNKMPNRREWNAALKAGRTGRLWYERSSSAFDALMKAMPGSFKRGDKEKFLNFVAALSPVQTVRSNLVMAIQLWDKWIKAGRPQDVEWKDEKKFSGVANKGSSALYRIVKGFGRASGVILPARMSNAIRALQGEPLSGPKVSAFAPNLGENVDKSTNDTWMAVFADTDPNTINKKHLYDAVSAHVRMAGKLEGIPARQVQSAIWSFIKALAELSGWGGDRWKPPQEIIEQGLLTPELIDAHAADFADMLANDKEIRAMIKKNGGDLNALDRELEKRVPARPAAKGSIAKLGPDLLNTAKRLETARTNARIQAHLERKSDQPSLFGDESFEFGGETIANPERKPGRFDLERKAVDEKSDPSNVDWSERENKYGATTISAQKPGSAEPVASISFAPVSSIPGAVWIIDAGRDDEFKGTGIGQTLYDKAIQRARQLGYRRLYAGAQSPEAEAAWDRLATRYPVRVDQDSRGKVRYVDLRDPSDQKPSRINSSLIADEMYGKDYNELDWEEQRDVDREVDHRLQEADSEHRPKTHDLESLKAEAEGLRAAL